MNSPAPAYDRRAVHSWAVYDFASSSFTTLVVTFLYGTFFAKSMITDVPPGQDAETIGQALWANAITITALIVSVLSPYAGTIADRGGYRKRFLLIATAVCVLGSAALFFPKPGQIFFALSVFVVANVAFEMGYVFYNAFLPDLAPQDKIGRLSGYGWGLGYLGGLLCMVFALVFFVSPETLPFGLSTEDGENIRATNLLVALWYALFSIPLVLFLREKEVAPLPAGTSVIRSANQQLLRTFQEIRKFRQIVRLLLARLIYNDGVITIFSFGGIYAAGEFGFSFEELLIFGITLNVAAGVGAMAFGFLDDRVGAKQTILITLIGLFLASLLAVTTHSKEMFWVAGIVVGLLAGPNQASSRSLMSRFIPPAMETEFFGFFAFSGKATAFLGPLLLGQLTGVFNSQRAGIAVVLAFFAFGALLLLRVNEQEGIALANRTREA